MSKIQYRILLEKCIDYDIDFNILDEFEYFFINKQEINSLSLFLIIFSIWTYYEIVAPWFFSFFSIKCYWRGIYYSAKIIKEQYSASTIDPLRGVE